MEESDEVLAFARSARRLGAGRAGPVVPEQLARMFGALLTVAARHVGGGAQRSATPANAFGMVYAKGERLGHAAN